MCLYGGRSPEWGSGLRFCMDENDSVYTPSPDAADILDRLKCAGRSS